MSQKANNERFFWFWSELQKPRGSFCMTPTRCCITSFGQVGRVSCWALRPPQSPPNPRTPLFSYKNSSHHLRVLGFIQFQFSIDKHAQFIVTVTSSSFAVNQDPCSCSTLLWRFILLWSELEPNIHLCFIHIRGVRLRVYPFSLVFFDLFAGKAFLARSIKLCLVDNQRSSSVMVADLGIVSNQKPGLQMSSLQQLNLSYLSEDRASTTSSGISIQVNLRYIIVFPFRSISFLYLQSTKKPKKSTLSTVL